MRADGSSLQSHRHGVREPLALQEKTPRSPVGARREGVRFDTEDGTKTLVELSAGRSQLLLAYNIMFGPD
jgi:predicted dithiol-disulfide oxidoreductase (DUF899 family)